MDLIGLIGVITLVVVAGWSIRGGEGIEWTMAWFGLLFLLGMLVFFPHTPASDSAMVALVVASDVGFCYAQTALKRQQRQLESKVNELLVEFEGVPHAPTYGGLDADKVAEIKRKIEGLKDVSVEG
ncbi:MAG: hypothetical protein ACYDA9_01530 [Terriglobia bacterium]